jgi:hypothetical protein
MVILFLFVSSIGKIYMKEKNLLNIIQQIKKDIFWQIDI